uniref:BioY protein n=1 Tax=mine drainage metagenome TaxID=410659 RepID=E6QK32_9ZZZZ
MDRTIKNETQVNLAAEAVSPAGLLLRRGAVVVSATLFVAVCAHVSIPLWFTPVPLTLQPFAVLLLGLLMTPGMAVATMVSYLAEGALGLPVFTPHGLGGLAQLLGPTGGYLLSYPIVAPLVSVLWRVSSRTFTMAAGIAFAGSFVTLAMGAAWLGYLTHLTPALLVDHAVLPFLPGDALKVLAAASIATSAGHIRQHRK